MNTLTPHIYNEFHYKLSDAGHSYNLTFSFEPRTLKDNGLIEDISMNIHLEDEEGNPVKSSRLLKKVHNEAIGGECHFPATQPTELGKNLAITINHALSILLDTAFSVKTTLQFAADTFNTQQLQIKIRSPMDMKTFNNKVANGAAELSTHYAIRSAQFMHTNKSEMRREAMRQCIETTLPDCSPRITEHLVTILSSLMDIQVYRGRIQPAQQEVLETTVRNILNMAIPEIDESKINAISLKTQQLVGAEAWRQI